MERTAWTKFNNYTHILCFSLYDFTTKYFFNIKLKYPNVCNIAFEIKQHNVAYLVP